MKSFSLREIEFVGTHEYGPRKAAMNTNFEHMGVMEQP